METFQELILNSSDTCSNCFGQQRRQATTTVEHPRNADHDEDGYPIEDQDGYWIRRYSERLQWTTTVDDVPGPVVHEAGTLFCDCGAPGAFTRIWDLCDFHPERLGGMLEVLFLRLEDKGVDVRIHPFCAAAREAYLALPEPGEYGPWKEDRPTTANDVFAAAVKAGTDPVPEPSATLSPA